MRTDAAARFSALYSETSRALLAYLVRRVDQPADAADLLGEVFATAWRRRDDVPAGDDARLWLYGVARRTLQDHRRSGARRSRLADRLRLALGERVDPPRPFDELHLALASLDEEDREVLTLLVWDGLTADEVGKVMGIRPGTVRVRAHRARERVRRLLEREQTPACP